MKLAALMFVAALSQSPPEERINLSDRQAIVCEAEGGCALITKMAFDTMTLEIFKAGLDQWKKDCRGSI